MAAVPPVRGQAARELREALLPGMAGCEPASCWGCFRWYCAGAGAFYCTENLINPHTASW